MGIISMMIYGLFIACLGAFSLIFGQFVSSRSNRLESLESIAVDHFRPKHPLSDSTFRHSKDRLPSVGLDTSAHYSLKSATATDPEAMGSGASAGVYENEVSQSGVETNPKSQDESCASPFKKL